MGDQAIISVYGPKIATYFRIQANVDNRQNAPAILTVITPNGRR